MVERFDVVAQDRSGHSAFKRGRHGTRTCCLFDGSVANGRRHCPGGGRCRGHRDRAWLVIADDKFLAQSCRAVGPNVTSCLVNAATAGRLLSHSEVHRLRATPAAVDLRPRHGTAATERKSVAANTCSAIDNVVILRQTRHCNVGLQTQTNFPLKMWMGRHDNAVNYWQGSIGSRRAHQVTWARRSIESW